jgi:hypothetical protein
MTARLAAAAGLVALGLAAYTATSARGPADLARAWAIRLVLEHPAERHARPQSREVLGQIALVPSADDVRPSWLRARNMEYIGVYDLNLKPWGFDVRPQADVPLAGAHLAGDSVEVRLNPKQEHGGLEFVGRLQGDTILGRWYEVNVGGASGTFQMWPR